MNFYAHEKIRELEEERQDAFLAVEATRARPRRRPIFGPLAGSVGRMLLRLGQGLESWASPSPARRVSGLPGFDQRWAGALGVHRRLALREMKSRESGGDERPSR